MKSSVTRILVVVAGGVQMMAMAQSSSVDIPGGDITGWRVGALANEEQSDRSMKTSGNIEDGVFQLPGYWGVTNPRSSTKLRARWFAYEPKVSGGDDNLFSLTKRQSSNICRVGGNACGAGKWCFAGIGCCRSDQMGCNGISCCPGGSVCCSGGLCCPKGYNCVIINGRRGCCKRGEKCVANGSTVDAEEGQPDTRKEDQCADRGYGLCPSGDFCCSKGRTCLRDPLGRPACQAGCSRTGWSVCPNNNFCCPPNAQCVVDEDGNNRCRVVVTTTVFVRPTATAGNDGDDNDDDEDATTAFAEPTESSEPEESASSSRSFKSTKTISRDKTITITPTSSSSEDSTTTATYGASVEAPAATTATEEPPRKVHNGGLDDIFTNSALQCSGLSATPLILWAFALILLVNGLVGL